MSFDVKAFQSGITKVFSMNGLGSYMSLEVVNKFIALTEFMLAENEKYNLTAITEPDKIILNHYADSAMPAKILPKGAYVADVGCGAGFPTLPLAIIRPDIKIVGIDSTAKRIGYVTAAAELVGAQNVSAIAARAEDLGQDAKYREKFDIVTARAVAALPVLSELCLPLVRVGGQFIAMKGKSVEGEVKDARRAIPILGAKLREVKDITVASPTESLTHPVIIIDKIQKTPAAYPRPYAKISKKPL